jgi:hypothetical protein
MAQRHVLYFVLKSARSTVQLVGACVFALLAVLLLFTTVFRWRYESALRDAIQQAATGEGDPLLPLEEARAARPDDILPYLVTGEIMLEKGARLAETAAAAGPLTAETAAPARKLFESAVKAFDHACEKRDKFFPTASESCVVGACSARLAIADLDATERPKWIDEAEKVLTERVHDKDDVDVVLVEAGIDWARGNLAGCSKILGDASTHLGAAGRGSVGSYYWHKGLIELIAKDPAALEDLRRSAMFRSGPAAGKAIGLAIRLAALDPAQAPKDPKELETKVTELYEIINQRVKNVTRWEMEKGDEALTWNAIGVAWTRVPNADKAGFCFGRASSLDKGTLLYRVNGAIAARYKPSVNNETPEQTQHRVDNEAAQAITSVLRTYDIAKDPDAQKENREKYCRDLLVAAMGLAYGGGRAGDAAGPIDLAHQRFGLDDAEYFRNHGALQDAARRLDLAVVDYKKAIAAGHKDSYKMQERIDQYEKRKR